jgi:hypothetical protein
VSSHDPINHEQSQIGSDVAFGNSSLGRLWSRAITALVLRKTDLFGIFQLSKQNRKARCLGIAQNLFQAPRWFRDQKISGHFSIF